MIQSALQILGLDSDDLPQTVPRPFASAFATFIGHGYPPADVNTLPFDLRLPGEEVRVSRMAARVLTAIRRALGRGVETATAFGEMFTDEEGGPSPARMHMQFRKALLKLDAALEGSSIGIAYISKTEGCRIILGGV